jgi:ABC-2 type transport system ATP-binding protein
MTTPSSDHLSPPAVVAEFRAATKWYGPVIGINAVSLEFGPGITCLLGSNGAGKTTLIKLLTGLLAPSLGEVRVGGYAATSVAARELVGFCPDVDAFYEEMTGRTFVRSMARLRGLSGRDARRRADEALAEVGMSDRADRVLRGCSKGMRQRVKLAQALVHRPRLLVVDEPLNGVDPVGRRELMEFFRRFAASGRAVVVSSHVLEEMRALADRVAFMARGRLLASGTLDEIRRLLARRPHRLRVDSPTARELAKALLGSPRVLRVDCSQGDSLVVEVLEPESFCEEFARVVLDGAFEVSRLEPLDAGAEAAYELVMEEARF